MNKLLFSLLFLTFFHAVAQEEVAAIKINTEFNIVGEWTGTSKSETGSFRFLADGFAYMVTPQLTVDSKQFTQNGKNFSLTYVIDYEKTPIHLDLIVTELDSQKEFILPGIIEIINDDTIKMALGFSGPRPEKMLDENEITLNRTRE